MANYWVPGDLFGPCLCLSPQSGAPASLWTHGTIWWQRSGGLMWKNWLRAMCDRGMMLWVHEGWTPSDIGSYSVHGQTGHYWKSKCQITLFFFVSTSVTGRWKTIWVVNAPLLTAQLQRQLDLSRRSTMVQDDLAHRWCAIERVAIGLNAGWRFLMFFLHIRRYFHA